MVHERWMESIFSCVGEFKMIIKGAEGGPLISRARNMILEQFLETEAEYLLFTDTDTVFGPGDVRLLLEARRPIVGALYFGILGGNPSSTFPVALKRQSGVLQSLDQVPERLSRVDAVGMGLTLIERRVVEHLGPSSRLNTPFAETIWCDKHEERCPEGSQDSECLMARHHGEDATFCLRAMKAGFETWLEPKARIGHVKSVVL